MKKRIRILGWFVAGIFVMGSAYAADPASDIKLITKKTLSLDTAKKLAAAAEAAMVERNWNFAVCIVDDAQNIITVVRRDGARDYTSDLACKKAMSAAKYQRPTKAFEEAVKKDPKYLNYPGLFLSEGGLPIVADNQVVGGIGISGGIPAEKDGIIAKAALDAVGLKTQENAQ